MKDYHFPLITLQEITLHTYEQVILRKGGKLYFGAVVSHLSVQDYADMHGYTYINHSSIRRARSHERTNLVVRNNGLHYKSTVVGMPAIKNNG